MASKITLRNLQDQEFSINHNDGAGAISIDSDKVVQKDANGNLGIGTTNVFSSGGKTIHLYNNLNDGTVASNSTLYVESINRNANIICKGLNAGFQGWDPSGNIAALYGIDTVNKIASITTNNTERMRIDANGNVGIGSTPSAWNPSYTNVQIKTASLVGLSASYFALSANAYINGASDLSNSNYITTGYANRFKAESGAFNWLIAPSGTAGNAITWTNTMSIQANGNLEHYMGGLYSFSASGITSTDYANSWVNIKRWALIDTTAVFEAQVVGVRKSAILANGTYQSATNVYGSTSDIKLKEKVVDTSPKLDKLMKVQVRNFNYIGQEEKQIGVIAQEIEQIFPGVVFETKDTKQVEVEQEDGTTKIETIETGEVTKNVKYSVIYMMMLKGMQEQQEIINNLKERIEILEGAK